MLQPLPFSNSSIQKHWHSIQRYQGDLVVKGEELSLYVNESDGDENPMDQITPLIDACADLSYRLDTHARLCVQYTADQVCMYQEKTTLKPVGLSLNCNDWCDRKS